MGPKKSAPHDYLKYIHVCIYARGVRFGSKSGSKILNTSPQPRRPAHDAAPSSQQALRSERTRAALLAAAAAVFARDGFEASRVEDIAAEAGRSRGAFYANFASKTEVFLALRVLATRRRALEMRKLFERLPDSEQRNRALLDHIARDVCDTQSLLLQIEFKLFALRHPERLEELAERHLEAVTSIYSEAFKDLDEPHDKDPEEMRRNTLLIEALLEGLAVNYAFCPRSLTPAYLAALLPTLLRDILFPSEPAQRTSASVKP